MLAKLLIAQNSSPGAQEARDDSTGGLVLIGGVAALLFLAALIAWASTMSIASAAIASGQVTVQGHRKAIQHRDGGPIAAVLVREGDLVEKGQVLLSLDLSDARAQLSVLQATKAQNLARLARLRAEASGAADMVLPSELTKDSGSPTRMVVQQESDLFTARREAHLVALSLLDQQILGFRQQIESLRGSQQAKETQLRLIREERQSIQPLVEKGLTTKSRALTLERAAAELESDLQETAAQIADQNNGIRQGEIGIAKLKRERQEDANKDLAQSEATLAEVGPQIIAVEERLGRGTLRAPERGYVFGLSVFGQGAVITPGQVVLEIVPADDALVLTVEVAPKDIDQVRVGQNVSVHLLSYRQNYLRKLRGVLRSISSDEITDLARERSYYRATVSLDAEDLAKSGAELVPGMPVNAMIQTGTHTIMSYFLDPLTRTFESALRDS